MVLMILTVFERPPEDFKDGLLLLLGQNCVDWIFIIGIDHHQIAAAAECKVKIEDLIIHMEMISLVFPCAAERFFCSSNHSRN